ncbi:MAG TPA: hypothetical protein DCP53_03215 [Elusimicrobia bacterium]|nr:MAG: hypothetical protein A2551_07125 [Elusimicrobia bacterium RIFOXYD2_FULL_34_30]HAM38400.1 hypothetical protein [Elusimicrobiota bacterium]
MKYFTLSNDLTIARIILVPVFILSLLANNKWLSISIFSFCILTDFLDGLFARMRGERTKLGSFLDPLADKLLLISSFIVLTILNKIPVWILVVVITKDFIVFLGWGLRYHIIRNSKVSPTIFGKISTVLEMSVVLLILLNTPKNILIPIMYLMLISIITSIFTYIIPGVREIEKK